MNHCKSCNFYLNYIIFPILSISSLTSLSFNRANKKISLSITDQFCVHCQNFQSSSLAEILEHCKLCLSMARPNAIRNKFVCCSCTTFSTYSSYNMKNHMNVHMGAKPHACILCDYRSVERKSLKLHMKKHHNNSSV